VVVIALLLSGVIPGFHLGGNSSSPSGPTTEQSAASTATSFAGGVSGAPWSLKFAGGTDSIYGESTNVSSFSNATCPLHGSTTSKVTDPGYNGTYSTGLADVWEFVFTSAAGAQLIIVVQNGAAVEAGQTTGPGCVPGGLTTLSGNLIDSSAAAQAALGTANGAKYASTVVHSNASYYLEEPFVGYLKTNAPIWWMLFSGCSGENSTAYEAVVYATNGTIWSSQYTSPTPSPSCGGKLHPPLGSALALGNARGLSCPTGSGVPPGDSNGCTAGDWEYTVVVESSTVTLDILELEVTEPGGGAFAATGSASFTILNVTGGVIASYVVGPGSLTMTSTWQTYLAGDSGSTPLTSVDTVVVDMGQTGPTTGQNLVLVGSASSSYSGTISFSLP